MKLREDAHKALDELDSRSLAVVYDLMRLILDTRSRSEGSHNAMVDFEGPVGSRELVLKMTASDKSNWAEDIMAEREDRV